MGDEEELVFHLDRPIDLDHGVIIDGFPSVGLVSTIAANYIISQCDLELVGSIHSPLMPIAAIIRDGVPTEPIRIYHGKGLLVFISEFRPPRELVIPLVNKLLAWEPVAHASQFITLEGLPLPEGSDQATSPIYAVGTTAAMEQQIKDHKFKRLDDGMITGLSGVLLTEGHRRQYPVLCLMAGAHEAFPDARGAARLVEAVDELLPQIDLPTGPLLKEADRVETAIRESLHRLHAAGGQTTGEAAESTEYIYR